MISDKFVIVGFIINLMGSSTYVIKTIQGKTRPNRISWFMWALAPIVAYAAEIHQHVGIQSLLTLVVGIGPAMVFTASFVNRKSVWKLTKFDLFCGSLSLLGLVLWLVTRQGDLAIACTIVGDAFASIPTIRKSFTNPETENHIVFLAASVNAILVLLTIKHWNFATYGFPIYILAVCIVLFSLIKFRIGPRLAQNR